MNSLKKPHISSLFHTYFFNTNKQILFNKNAFKYISNWVDKPILNDPSQEYLSQKQNILKHLFEPKNVALIGATNRPKTVGKTICENLMNGSKIGGKFNFFPINPKKNQIFGQKCYKSILDIDEHIDLAVIATPANTVSTVMKDVVSKNVETAIVISAGFKELGYKGLQIESDLLQTLSSSSTRMIGPNCLGVMRPSAFLNASFAEKMPPSGSIAFLSQSGALCTSVLDISSSHNIGFSAFVSVGSMADLHWGDLLEYFAQDTNTSSILIYMETIGQHKQLQHFLSAAKQLATYKPIIVIKAGKTPQAAQAAVSHTGSLAGEYEVFQAAMKRVGVITVDTISELFNCASVLSKQHLPKGPNLTIITNAGGPAVLATDALISTGGKLTKLEENIINNLNNYLPSSWSHANPVDVLGDANGDAYKAAISNVWNSKLTDAILIILTPQSTTECTYTAELIRDFVISKKNENCTQKMVLASWMGGPSVQKGKEILLEANIPSFDYPDEAAAIFSKMWKRHQQLEMIYEIPDINVSPFKQNSFKEKAVEFLSKIYLEGRTILTENESKTILDIYNLPVDICKICLNCEEAIYEAEKMGFPVVLKLNSKKITHKKDVGGVQLNIQNKQQVIDAFNTIKDNVCKLYDISLFQGVSIQPMISYNDSIELLLGSYTDEQFGPIIMFGSGGTFVEIYNDKSLAIPPFNSTLAKRLIEDTKIYKALIGDKGKRFKGINIEELERIILRFAMMIVELREFVNECDINPLLVNNNKFLCIDGRFILHKQTKQIPPLAIRPYPVQYVSHHFLKNGEKITIRPLYSNDEIKMKEFHYGLSSESIKQRYLKDVSLEDRIARQYLISVCNSDYNNLIALAVLDKNGVILGIGRISRLKNVQNRAEFKLVIKDDYQKRGIGSLLLDSLINVAYTEGYSELFGLILEENSGMLKMLKNRNFNFSHNSLNSLLIEAKLDII